MPANFQATAITVEKINDAAINAKISTSKYFIKYLVQLRFLQFHYLIR